MEELVQTPSQAMDPDAEGNESEPIRRAQHTAPLNQYNNTDGRSQGETADGSPARSSVASNTSRDFEMSPLDVVPDLSRHEVDRRARGNHREYPVGGSNTRGARHGRHVGRRVGQRVGRRGGQTIFRSALTVVNAWATQLYAFGYFMAAILLALDWGFLLGLGEMLRDIVGAIVEILKLLKKPVPSPKVAAPVVVVLLVTMWPTFNGPSGSGYGTPPLVFERPSHGRVLEQLSMQGHVLREARGLLNTLEIATIATPMGNNFTKAKRIMARGTADLASALREYRVHYRDGCNEAELFLSRVFTHNMTLQQYTPQQQFIPGPLQWIPNLFGWSQDMDALVQLSTHLGGCYLERLDSLDATIQSFDQDRVNFKSVGLKVNATMEIISWEGALSEQDTKRWYALSASLQMSSKAISAALKRFGEDIGALRGEKKHIKKMRIQLADEREAMMSGVKNEAEFKESMVSQIIDLLGG